MRDLISKFIDAMRAAGCGPEQKSGILADDKWHSYQLEGDPKSKKAGYYRLKIEGDFAVGNYGSRREGITHSWHSKSSKKWTDEEKLAWKTKLEADKKQKAEEILARQNEVAAEAEKLWSEATPVNTDPKNPEAIHPYLAKKQISGEGWRIHSGDLLIPMKDSSTKLWGVQKITPEGDKYFQAGGRKEGCYAAIVKAGQKLTTIIIVEGAATGRSVHEATGLPVVIAFDAGNLLPVAKAIRAKYPQAKIIFAADNDQFTKIKDIPFNVGIEKAKIAALEVGGHVVHPEFPPDGDKNSDYNDAYWIYGAEYVRNSILAASEHAAQDHGQGEENPLRDVERPLPVDAGEYQPPEHLVQYETQIKHPFRILGHNNGTYYFLPERAGQVVSLTAGMMGGLVNLIRLADMNHWQDNFGLGGKAGSGQVALAAANALMTEAHRIGIFRPQNIRGCGAWIDAGRKVLHCGDVLLSNGEHEKPYKFSSKFVYPASDSVITLDAEPLSNTEAVKLRDICRRLSWDSPLSGELLAGWLVVAPVCSALSWRPHVWVVGESQSGKSTVLNDIIGPILGRMALRVDGGTTEAALRQLLGHAGRPVIYDEAEAETLRDKIIMDGVLQLVRRSSSGGTVVKGSPTGDATMFIARSSFCFSGINPALKHRADESRITKLFLRRNNVIGADKVFAELQADIYRTFTEEYSAALLARTIRYLDVLLDNCKIFVTAASAVLCDRRAADQIGPMLAGLYLLTNTGKVNFDSAVVWIKQHDWSYHTMISEADDPERMISHIASHMVRVHGQELTLGRIMEAALGLVPEITELREYHAVLRSYGIIVEHSGITISNNSPMLTRALKETPWTGWKDKLITIKGATKTPEALRFCPGIVSRGVKLPCDVFGIIPDKSKGFAVVRNIKEPETDEVKFG